METEILDEQQENEKNINESVDNETELFEAAKEKHSSNKTEREKFSDIFAVQLMLCILIILVFVVINIFDNTITEWYIDKFKEMSMYETEEFFRKAVNYAEEMLK